MQKILFTEFAELKQGDGLGPKFFAGKAYHLTDDQAERWKSEGVAVDAPDDMAAENEPTAEPIRPQHVQIKLVKRNRYDVTVRDETINKYPLTAQAAERLRADILEGKVLLVEPVKEEAIPDLPPDLPPPAEEPEPPEHDDSGYLATS